MLHWKRKMSDKIKKLENSNNLDLKILKQKKQM